MKTLRISTVGLACVVVLMAAQSGEGRYLCPNKPLAFSDASFIGEGAEDMSGYCVSSAGDANGDGYDDILIGAPNSIDDSDTGETYLVFGKPTGWSMDTPLALSDASFIDEDEDDAGGEGLSLAGDVNGDGYDDILIGAPNRWDVPDSGKTYLIFGKPTGWSMDTPLALSDASFIAEASGDESGIHVSLDGNVNGDGYDDILIGAMYNDEGGHRAGQAYLIFGKPTGWSMDTSLSLSDASFIGEASGDHAGDRVSSAGDVDADGYDDILIGATHWPSGAGKAYLILGKPTGWIMDTPLAFSDASFVGEAPGDVVGIGNSLAGDVDADGHDDILTGAHHNDEGGNSAGQTYLNFGGEVGVLPELSVQVTPDTTLIHLGEELWFTTDIVNLTNSTVTFQAQLDGFWPNGNPYGDNPVLGPVVLTLGPGSGLYGVRRYVHVCQGVPPGGPYRLCVRTGMPPNSLWAQDCFEFEVVP